MKDQANVSKADPELMNEWAYLGQAKSLLQLIYEMFFKIECVKGLDPMYQNSEVGYGKVIESWGPQIYPWIEVCE